jgi:hypothetical protein
MKKTLSVFAFRLLCAIPAAATTRYVAQTAGTFSGGTACNEQTAITPATFNGLTLSPGDITWLCGVINVSSGANGIKIAQSGTSSSPITLLFDTGGAILQSPVFGNGANSGIYLSGQSWNVVNGGNTGNTTGGTTRTSGIVQNYATGTSGATNCPGISNTFTGACSNQIINTTPIEMTGASNIIIENLGQLLTTVVTPGSSSPGNGAPGSDAIHFQGSNVTITNNQFLHSGMGVDNTTYNNDSNTVISYNDFQDDAWGIGCAGGTVTNSNYQVFGNHFHNWTSWYNSNAHLNGIFCFNGSGGGISTFYLRDNLFDGTMSATGWTTWLHFGSDAGGPRSNGTGLVAWNSVVVSTVWLANGLLQLSGGSANQVYNNTFMQNGNVGSQTNGVCSPGELRPEPASLGRVIFSLAAIRSLTW